MTGRTITERSEKASTQGEIGAVRTRRGKWSDEGVPHKGWRCVHIEDLGKPLDLCQMCESQDVRFVHEMQHQDYVGSLRVGCVCAGHMEEDLVGARLRDKDMRDRATRKKRWLKRRWKVSRAGNEWIEADGYRVIVHNKGGQWFGRLVALDGSLDRPSKRSYATGDEVKLAAFDAVTFLLWKRDRTPPVQAAH